MKKVQCHLFVVFIICMAWQAAFAQEKGSSQEWFQRGMALESKRVYQEAINMFTKAIDLDKNYVDAYLERGRAYRASCPTVPEVSMADFDKAVAIDPGNAEAYFQRGLLNGFVLNIEKAVMDMKTAAGLGHKGAEAWLVNAPLRTEAKPFTEMKKGKEAESEGKVTTAKGKLFDLNNYLPSKSEPTIHFDFDKSNIKKDFQAILDEVGIALKDKLTDVKIIVAGHTDNIGKDSYNDDLSLLRADAVKSYLESLHGISPERIITKGHGSNNPISTNETEEGRAKNRRTHIQIVE